MRGEGPIALVWAWHMMVLLRVLIVILTPFMASRSIAAEITLDDQIHVVSIDGEILAGDDCTIEVLVMA